MHLHIALYLLDHHPLLSVGSSLQFGREVVGPLSRPDSDRWAFLRQVAKRIGNRLSIRGIPHFFQVHSLASLAASVNCTQRTHVAAIEGKD